MWWKQYTHPSAEPKDLLQVRGGQDVPVYNWGFEPWGILFHPIENWGNKPTDAGLPKLDLI